MREPLVLTPRTGLLVEMLLVGPVMAIVLSISGVVGVDAGLALLFVGYQAVVLLMWPVFRRGSEIRLHEGTITGPNGRILTVRARVRIALDELLPEPVTTRMGRAFGYSDLASADGRKIRIIHRVYGQDPVDRLLRRLA